VRESFSNLLAHKDLLERIKDGKKTGIGKRILTGTSDGSFCSPPLYPLPQSRRGN